jgi:hypothetical protein
VLFATGLIAALAGGAGVYLHPGSETREVDTALKNAQKIREAVVDWRADNPSGCPTLSQLKQEKRLASQAVTDDPWGQRYRVECSGDAIRVVSPGRDGLADTSDDIRVPHS